MKNESNGLVTDSEAPLKKFKFSGHSLESSGDLVITADGVSSDADFCISESFDGKMTVKANNIYINNVDISNDKGLGLVAKNILSIDYGSFFGHGDRPAQDEAMSFKP